MSSKAKRVAFGWLHSQRQAGIGNRRCPGGDVQAPHSLVTAERRSAKHRSLKIFRFCVASLKMPENSADQKSKRSLSDLNRRSRHSYDSAGLTRSGRTSSSPAIAALRVFPIAFLIQFRDRSLPPWRIENSRGWIPARKSRKGRKS